MDPITIDSSGAIANADVATASSSSSSSLNLPWLDADQVSTSTSVPSTSSSVTAGVSTDIAQAHLHVEEGDTSELSWNAMLEAWSSELGGSDTNLTPVPSGNFYIYIDNYLIKI